MNLITGPCQNVLEQDTEPRNASDAQCMVNLTDEQEGRMKVLHMSVERGLLR